ncbi:DUF2207 domain-containing protein [Cohaesibacter gelatinilyticus]|uniref:Predicted membrane protein n=1 Tax=Cohaesibacter gelatinilyticus TaxID=372072 RepID=A0A285N9F6_9HYPH|nr:DUF2207 domain-containing protein [Cohaesibacter gelatinilyticus]SNZ06095.1 Predicted membrane protein [Cohaesibacter gelatinilyticus]
MPSVSCPARILAIAWIALAAVFLTSSAWAREEILDYKVDVTVNLDRSIDVVETIKVDVKGQEIRRGIFRDLTVKYVLEDGSPLNLDVSNISIQRNGRSEPFQTSYTGRYLRMKIGDKDRYLSHEPHTYRISYNVDDFVAFFDDVDEIYWNAIGTGWNFPIRKANVSVTIPQGGKILQSVVYTGTDGSEAQDGSVTEQSDTYINYRANRPLKIGEGMTVAVGWEKGLIAPPTKEELRMKALVKDSPLYGLALLALGNFAWFYRTWRKWGKDPRAGTIIPRFHPPKDISPALASYIHGVGSFVGSRQKAFMASLVSLSIKGFLRLDKTGSKLKVHSLDKIYSGELRRLPVGETSLMSSLFYDDVSSASPRKKEGRDQLIFSNLSYSVMSGAMGAFTRDIETITNQKYFNRNYGTAVPTIILIIIALIGFIGSTIAFNPYNAIGIGLAIAGVIAGGVIYGCWALWRSSKLAAIIVMAFVAIFAGLVFMIVAEEGGLTPSSLANFLVFGVFAGMALLVPFAFDVMKAPTEDGQKIIDQLNGLKLFMTVVIAEKVDAMDMPELTPDLYEELLPYAIALGVDKEWTQNFETLVFSQLPPEQHYDPDWYDGDYSDGHFSSSDIDNMNSALSSDLSESLTPPASSSSGSSGGGSSGGGGGGGGGGGW